MGAVINTGRARTFFAKDKTTAIGSSSPFQGLGHSLIGSGDHLASPRLMPVSENSRLSLTSGRKISLGHLVPRLLAKEIV